MNMTPLQFKTEAAKAKTYADMNSLFKNTDINMLKDFVHAAKSAQKFVQLTMRDETMLSSADHYIANHS